MNGDNISLSDLYLKYTQLVNNSNYTLENYLNINNELLYLNNNDSAKHRLFNKFYEYMIPYTFLFAIDNDQEKYSITYKNQIASFFIILEKYIKKTKNIDNLKPLLNVFINLKSLFVWFVSFKKNCLISNNDITSNKITEIKFLNTVLNILIELKDITPYTAYFFYEYLALTYNVLIDENDKKRIEYLKEGFLKYE